jgi:hypothetical protein
MPRRNLPDINSEVVKDDNVWAIWLIVIVGGVLGVFAVTVLIVSLLING